jgi:hypothetical protein
MLTAGGIGIAGDMAMQVLEQRKQGVTKIDHARSARLSAFRIVQAPFLSVAWRTFDRWVPWPGASAVAAKVFLDQLLLMPPSMSSFFMTQGLMEGLPLQDCLKRTQETLPSTMLRCVPYWCTVHIVTFGFIPVTYRIAWTSLAAVGWNMYISHVNADARRREEEALAPVV